AAVVAPNHYVDRLWTIQKEIKEIAGELTAVPFDYVLDLHGNLRTLDVKTRLFVNGLWHLRPRPKMYRFSKLNFRKYLLTRFGINRMPNIHIVDRYLATAAPLGVKNDGKGLDYFIAPQDRVALSDHRIPKGYLALVIGAAHATKRLTDTQLATFCHQLSYPIVLLGGPAERDLGERLAAGRNHVTNACGTFSLGGSADLVRQAQVVVTHDTGLMHVAAAFRKPIVSVWGNTVPDFGMYPYLPGAEDLEKQRRREVKHLPCRPCSKIGFQQCPQGHFRCIADQDPGELADFAAEILRDAK
ncbi:MAG: glycosyltransferase family 9 protein, partial [Bacteroidota bacterium]